MDYLNMLAGQPPQQDSPGSLLYSLMAMQPQRQPLQRAGMGGAPSNLIGLARKLEAKGFDVGELEGFQGQGPITSGHAPNSLHYSGNAMDVNYNGAGRWGNETQALDWLYKWLNKRYDPQELLWQTDDHWDHLHLGGI